MDATLELLIPDRKGIRERIATAVREGGGRVRLFHVRRRMPGIHEVVVDITYAHPLFLHSILASLGRLAGVAIRGFDPRKSGVSRAP